MSITQREYDNLARRNRRLAIVTIVFIVSAVLASVIYQKMEWKDPRGKNWKPLHESGMVKTDIVLAVAEAKPTRSLESIKTDPIAYIRYRGEELGVSNTTIRTMIRISKCESGHRANAQNGTSTARGLFQILIGTWENPHYDCEGKRTNIVDNVNCAYKIYQYQSKYYPKHYGKEYEFSDWNESKSCWEEK